MKRQVRLECKWLILFTIIHFMDMDVVRSDDFLTEFETDINNIAKGFDTLVEHVEGGSSPESIKICVLSQDEYLEIWNIIDSFSDDFDNPSITIVQSSKCTEVDAFDRFKLWILQFKNDVNEIMKTKVWSDEYIRVVSKYQNMVSKFKCQTNLSANIDKRCTFTTKKDTVFENVAAKGKDVITNLRKECETHIDRVSLLLKRLQTKQRQINEKIVEDCATEVKANRIESAVKIFSTITEERLIRDIVHTAYENPNSFQGIFEFIDRMGDSSASLYGYQALFVVLASKQLFTGLNVLIFLHGVEKRNSETHGFLANSLKIQLKRRYATNDYSDFYSAVNRNYGGKVDFGLDIMPTFVRNAYNGDLSNVMKILDMRTNFTNVRHQLFLLDSLIAEMKLEDHTNKLEFFIVLSDVMDLKVEIQKHPNEQNEKTINQIYENIPDNLRPLIKANLCIQNAKTNEYVHAGNTVDGTRRPIFTSVSNKFDDTFNFEVEFIERGRKFLLKNLVYGEYLYSGNGEPSRKLSLMKALNLKDDKEAHFTIEAIDSINVRIKNEKFNEYLYSPTDKFDQSDRHINLKSQISEDGLWTLSTCNFPKN